MTEHVAGWGRGSRALLCSLDLFCKISSNLGTVGPGLGWRCWMFCRSQCQTVKGSSPGPRLGIKLPKSITD